jgi:hypothetical protein
MLALERLRCGEPLASVQRVKEGASRGVHIKTFTVQAPLVLCTK